MAHCDDFGSKEFQLSETQSRAKWVYDFLIMKGISKNQIEYQGMGSSFPLKTTENLKKSVNRRIELEITQK
jgi:outer membrane protein OmpA-like peptidoglycan-associated protein